jgi:hypothetical protein
MKIKIYFHALVLVVLCLINSCNREPIPPPDPVIDRISVSDLRKMFAKGVQTIDTNIYIQGIITLTPELNNLPAFVAYFQDSTAAICLTVSGVNTFAMNSEVKILCRGASFKEFNGLLQFGDINITEQCEVIKLNSNGISPKSVTLNDLLSGKYQAEYVLVNNTQFKDLGTFSGTKILTDCKSQVEVYTRSDATFASQQMPLGNGIFKGIASIYTDIQLLIRESTELEMKANRCGAASVVYLNQDFSNLAKNADISTITGWKSYSEMGSKNWYGNEVGTRKWVQATAFNSGQASVITWMIAPVLDLSRAEKPVVTFESANGYDNGATFELFISQNYNGSVTPWTSTWTKLNFTLPISTTSGYSQFEPSGQIDLSPFIGGPVYLAWVYKGADPTGSANDKTTTWELDNVIVAEK